MKDALTIRIHHDERATSPLRVRTRSGESLVDVQPGKAADIELQLGEWEIVLASTSPIGAAVTPPIP